MLIVVFEAFTPEESMGSTSRAWILNDPCMVLNGRPQVQLEVDQGGTGKDPSYFNIYLGIVLLYLLVLESRHGHAIMMQ